jgi:hypothetical protein
VSRFVRIMVERAEIGWHVMTHMEDRFDRNNVKRVMRFDIAIIYVFKIVNTDILQSVDIRSYFSGLIKYVAEVY